MGTVRRITRGAELLRSHLDAIGESIPTFCEKHRLCRIQVQRVIKGERTRISVDFAKAIQEATGGAVPWDSWSSDTLHIASAA
jgi:hypothetical protein